MNESQPLCSKCYNSPCTCGSSTSIPKTCFEITDAIKHQDIREIRKFAFEQAVKIKRETYDAYECIFVACEIEAYILNGEQLRKDFIASVECAIADVRCRGVDGVSKLDLEKVLELVEEELKDYDALD